MNQKIISAYMSSLGKKGGLKTGTAKVRGDADYYKRISALGVKARKRNGRARAKGTKSNGR